MSRTSNCIALLARQPHPVFHSRDLAHLWDIENKNTLHTLLKRCVQKGLLFRLYKGLYSLRPPESIDPLLLGVKALHSYAYVSTETILIQSGLMMQMTYAYTLVGTVSRHFKLGPHSFRVRKLQDQYLYNTAGIQEKNGVLQAGPERALADLLYFNPASYIDGRKRADRTKLHQIQKAIGYKIT